MTPCTKCEGSGWLYNPVRSLGQSRTGRISCKDCGGTGDANYTPPQTQSRFGIHLREPKPRVVKSLADEISKLARLRDQGVITEIEFQRAKQKLLD